MKNKFEYLRDKLEATGNYNELVVSSFDLNNNEIIFSHVVSSNGDELIENHIKVKLIEWQLFFYESADNVNWKAIRSL